MLVCIFEYDITERNKSTLQSLSLSDIFLWNATFRNIIIDQTNFTSIFENVDFQSGNLKKFNVANALFDDDNFSFATLKCSDFSYAEFFNATFSCIYPSKQ